MVIVTGAEWTWAGEAGRAAAAVGLRLSVRVRRGGGIFGTGQFVIGFLGDDYWSDMRGDRPSLFTSKFFSAREKVMDSQWAVGGRIGWLVNPNTSPTSPAATLKPILLALVTTSPQ